MVTVMNDVEKTIPISMFNNGMADEIFEDVRRSGTKIVMKNNLAECVLMSPEEYCRINDEYNDFKLLMLAHERMANFDPSKLISKEEMDKYLGITEEDLEGWEEVEIE